MAYKALYRIYRPNSFDEMVGQRHIITTIRNAIKEDKIAHAYLFSGPRGTGKTSLAKLVAKALNCTDPDHRPCNKCDNCKAINTNSHPDIIEIDAASNNGVDEVREIVDKVKYSPILGKYKVYIIDEVHMMTTGAFNALLKTLEEPPSQVIFILATTDVHKVIPTIVSRCQRFDFGRVNTNDIKNRISEVLSDNQIEHDQEVVEMIADLAEGGMRDAWSILDQTIAYAGNSITSQHVRDIYGIATSNEMIAFLQNCHANNVVAMLNAIKDFENKGLDFVRLTSSLIDILKEAIIYYKSQDESLLKVLNAQKASSLCMGMSCNDLFRDIDILVEAQANYRRVNTPKDFFQLAALKICDLYAGRQQNPVHAPQNPVHVQKPTPQVATPAPQVITPAPQVITPAPQVQSEPIKPTPAPTPAPQVQSTPQIAKEAKVEVINTTSNKKIFFTDEDIINILVQATKGDKDQFLEKWPLVRKYMGLANFAKAASLIVDAEPKAICKNAVLFTFDMASQANLINNETNQELIEALLKEIYGKKFFIFGLPNDKFASIRQHYITLHTSNALPPPRPIGQPYIGEEKVVEKEEDKNLTFFQNLFGDDIKVEE